VVAALQNLLAVLEQAQVGEDELVAKHVLLELRKARGFVRGGWRDAARRRG
jgi:hypothetical protein